MEGEYYRSLVTQLVEQGMIKKPIVGMNLEFPRDKSKISRVTFGSIDYEEVVNGRDGLMHSTNYGVGKWALAIQEFLYSDGNLMEVKDSKKVGLIDSS